MTIPEIPAVDSHSALTPMETMAHRALALHLQSLNININNQALDHLLMLWAMYMDQLLSDLHKITHNQRRRRATPTDLKYVVRDFNIDTDDLDEEVNRVLTQDVVSRRQALYTDAQQLKESNSDADEDIPMSNPSYVFFTHDDIVRLIPPMNTRAKNILPWMPQFPPDHTYRKTPNYTQRITDQALVRTKLAEESRLGEMALESLITLDNDKRIVDPAYDFDEETHLDHTSASDKKFHFDIDTSQLVIRAPLKPLDIVAYSNERLAFLESQSLRKQRKLKRNAHEKKIIRLVKNQSSYQDSYDDTLSVDEFIDSQYNKAMATFTSLKQQKEERAQRRSELIMEAKRLKEEELKRKLEMHSYEERLEQFEGHISNVPGVATLNGTQSDGVAEFEGPQSEGIDVETHDETASPMLLSGSDSHAVESLPTEDDHLQEQVQQQDEETQLQSADAPVVLPQFTSQQLDASQGDSDEDIEFDDLI